jgi:pteridine reductase
LTDTDLTKHRVALITGAAHRVGAEISRTFHKHGYDIALHYNNSAKAASILAQELNAIRSNSALTFKAQLTNVSDIKAMVKEVLLWRNALDVLINNASSFHPGTLENSNEKQWDELMGSNLKGPYFLCQAVAAHLRENGSIISINDIYASSPLKGYSVYCIAKAGNAMLTKSLAKELAPKIRVNGIAPGVILWPVTGAQMSEEIKQKIMDNIPLKRKGDPKDIAETAIFLATSAGYITGQTIAVDGGSSA